VSQTRVPSSEQSEEVLQESPILWPQAVAATINATRFALGLWSMSDADTMRRFDPWQAHLVACHDEHLGQRSGGSMRSVGDVCLCQTSLSATATRLEPAAFSAASPRVLVTE
jgi:hypothetical protein